MKRINELIQFPKVKPSPVKVNKLPAQDGCLIFLRIHLFLMGGHDGWLHLH